MLSILTYLDYGPLLENGLDRPQIIAMVDMVSQVCATVSMSTVEVEGARACL